MVTPIEYNDEETINALVTNPRRGGIPAKLSMPTSRHAESVFWELFVSSPAMVLGDKGRPTEHISEIE